MGTHGKINVIWWNIKINLQKLVVNIYVNELPTNLQNFTQKDSTEVKIFQKVLGCGQDWAIAIRSRVRCAHKESAVTFQGAGSLYGGGAYGTPVAAATASINFTAGFFFTAGRNLCDILGGGRYVKITKLIYPICVQRHRTGWRRPNCRQMFSNGELEWLGYHTLKKLWRYVKPFR